MESGRIDDWQPTDFEVHCGGKNDHTTDAPGDRIVERARLGWPSFTCTAARRSAGTAVYIWSRPVSIHTTCSSGRSGTIWNAA